MLIANLLKTSGVQIPSKLRGPFENATEAQMREIVLALYKQKVESIGSRFIDNDATMDKIQKVAKWLCKKDKPGLFLYGLCGTGKTVMERVIQQILSEGRADGNCLKVTAVDLHSSFRDNEKGWIYETFKTNEVSVIDDLGCEPERCMIYGVDYQPIQTLFYYRYEKRLITVLSTNLDDKMIAERYGVRVWDRIEEMFDRIQFLEESFRHK